MISHAAAIYKDVGEITFSGRKVIALLSWGAIKHTHTQPGRSERDSHSLCSINKSILQTGKPYILALQPSPCPINESAMCVPMAEIIPLTKGSPTMRQSGSDN